MQADQQLYSHLVDFILENQESIEKQYRLPIVCFMLFPELSFYFRKMKNGKLDRRLQQLFLDLAELSLENPKIPQIQFIRLSYRILLLDRDLVENKESFLTQLAQKTSLAFKNVNKYFQSTSSVYLAEILLLINLLEAKNRVAKTFDEAIGLEKNLLLDALNTYDLNQLNWHSIHLLCQIKT